MDNRAYGSFFSSNKSLYEFVVDTFNYIYERSPLNFSSITGIYHPIIPRVSGHPLHGMGKEVTGSPDGLFNVFEKMANLAVDENNPRGMAYCSLSVIPAVMVTRPADIAQILFYNDEKVFRGIPALADIFGHENLFALPDGATWREKRNILRRWILSADALTDLAPKMQKIIDEIAEQLKQNGEVESLEHFLVSLTMNVFAQTSMGSAPLANDNVQVISDGLGNAIDKSSDPVYNVIAKLMSAIDYYRQQYSLPIRTCLDEEKESLRVILEDNFLKPQAEKIKASENLLKEYFDRNPGNDTAAFKEAYSDTALFLLAGQETTERLLQFTLILLKKHPQVLEKLREEIARIQPENNQWDKKTLDQMHYLGKILKEVLRLYPPIPIIPRMVSTPLTLADIPLCHTRKEYEDAMENRDKTKDIILTTGTNITIMPWVTQKLASLYENPMEFNPDRHTSESISVTGEDKSKFCSFIPFGAGSRDCPGRFFAIQEAKIALIKFVKEFDFTTSLDDAALETFIRGTLKIKNEVHANFTPRITN